MAIITISRGSYSKGKDVAELVGRKLGYDVFSRDILLEAADHYNTDEIKLVRALHDAPSIFDRFSLSKERYIAYIEDAFLQRVKSDNVVYHGLAGHFFLKDIKHVLKVRIIADMEDRIKLEMEREKISHDEARRILRKDDQERRRWSQTLYGVDTTDPNLYDLLLHIRKITVEDAADIICFTAGLDHFNTTDDSRQALKDLSLAARVKALLVASYPVTAVEASNGRVNIQLKAPLNQQGRYAPEVTNIARDVDGVNDIELRFLP